jgi:hypothetical protein
LGNDYPETHEDAAYINNGFWQGNNNRWNNQPHPQGGNSNFNSNYNSNQPSLKDLVLGQAKINESITKKLTFNDKMIENINSKLEGLTSSVKNQLSFNKMIDTHKFLKLLLPFLLIMKERSRDNPRILLKKLMLWPRGVVSPLVIHQTLTIK